MRKHTVLHDITNDTELVKVAATALSTEWLLECDLNVIDVVTVPGSTEEFVSESENQQIFDHLLTEIVVDTEKLIFVPVRSKSLL